MGKLYPDSEVELTPRTAKYYDKIMNIGSLGLYNKFIKQAIHSMSIKSETKILDMGAGTGRNALIMNHYLSDKGKILGLEISDQMLEQFRDKTKNEPNISVKYQRIDQPFTLDNKFDIVFISFVLHGFPHKVRKIIIDNAYRALNHNGKFVILDFNEFKLDAEPFYFRIPFKIIECKYAFDFVARDWKQILENAGFIHFTEKTFLKDYTRLLMAVKK